MAALPWKKLLPPTRLLACFPITPKNQSYVFKALACSMRTEEEVKGKFEAWLMEYNVSYDTFTEKQERLGVFKDNLRLIDLHNTTGDRSMKLGLNRFADMTLEERIAKFCGGVPRRRDGDDDDDDDEEWTR